MLNSLILVQRFSLHYSTLKASSHYLLIHTHNVDITRSNSGFGVLLKDTLTHGLEKPGIKLPTFRLGDVPLLLLSQSCPHFYTF